MPLVTPGTRVSAAGTSSLPTNNLAWYGYIAYDGKNRLVAASNSGTQTAYSTDNGLTWTGVTVTSANYYGVGYIPTVFCVLISSSRNVLTSSDGTSWTTQTNALPTSRAWQRIVGGNGTLVVNQFNGQYVATSTNGTTWSEASVLPANTYWASLAFGDYSGGRFVVVPNSTSTSGNSNVAAYSSNNGASWSSVTLPSSGVTWSVAYGNGVFVAARNSTGAAYSTDGGATWTAATMPSAAANGWSVAYAGNGVFLAATNTNPSTTGAISYDLGNTWSAWTFPASAWWETTGSNAGDRVVWLGRSSNTGMYLATSKSGPTPVVTAVTRAATF